MCSVSLGSPYHEADLHGPEADRQAAPGSLDVSGHAATVAGALASSQNGQEGFSQKPGWPLSGQGSDCEDRQQEHRAHVLSSAEGRPRRQQQWDTMLLVPDQEPVPLDMSSVVRQGPAAMGSTLGA